jgi:hypothetical protein
MVFRVAGFVLEPSTLQLVVTGCVLALGGRRK